MARKRKVIQGSFVRIFHKFSAIRVVEDELIPVNIDLTVTMMSYEDTDDRDAVTAAYRRVNLWLEANLIDVIIVDTQNEFGMTIASHVGNVVLMCPDAPSDDILAQVIHHKLSVISNNSLYVGQLGLHSSDSQSEYVFENAGTTGYLLPKTVGEYISVPSLYDVPWWARDDGFCFELLKPESQSHIPDDEYFGDVTDPLEQVEEELAYLSGSESQSVIKVEKWTPKVV